MRKAFTLIELLVVIAIVSILAAILFPVFSQAKASAKQTVCLNNQKQLGVATLLYAVDSDDKYPGNTLGAPNEANGDAGLFMPLGFLDPAMSGGLNWGRELLPYVKTLGVFTCPTAVKASQLSPPLAPGRDESAVPGAGNTAYLFNGVVSLKSATSIPLPAQTITFQEAGTLRRLSTVRPRMVPGTPNTYTEVNRSLRHDSHRVGANIAFCDGHAAYRRKSALRYADFGFPVALNPAPLPTHLSDDAVQAEVEKLLVFQADF